ncbi:MAG: NUDIX hydrolase [Candidatus Woesebacteria bacterium GW2011_GWA1_41_13b]|uniref:NUDIX hydrolase n=1 Tax=Candidatus Woesebacteria bacterium GW2011_GWA1_41_13b TaxID=1618555 RepID=A0A0G0UWS4_9BACT|nr:MAG: NUDIX hydrolase [Candidatus Woesebacteria bacterium GW2011_GWA1_41_13b]
MKQLHNTQLEILKKLLFASSLRYARLKPDPEMENNQFNFHLNQLIDGGYVIKGGRNYGLTNFGKEYANRMDTDQTIIAKQSKISAWVCCIRTMGGKKQYLIYTRLKQPFYGCQGFMSGKVAYGEKVLEAAKRELKEETGLQGNAQIVSIKHFLVFDKTTNELVEDKFMFLCLVKNPTGKLTANNEGKYEWVEENKFKQYVTNHFESFPAFMKQVEEIKSYNGQVSLQEINHWSSKF